MLPAGPTVRDMMANAALYFGAAHMLARNLDDAEVALPFALGAGEFLRSRPARSWTPKSIGSGGAASAMFAMS